MFEIVGKLPQMLIQLNLFTCDPYFFISGVFREVGQPVMEVQFKLVHRIANRWPEYFHSNPITGRQSCAISAFLTKWRLFAPFK